MIGNRIEAQHVTTPHDKFGFCAGELGQFAYNTGLGLFKKPLTLGLTDLIYIRFASSYTI
jgi:hypothetical protein